MTAQGGAGLVFANVTGNDTSTAVGQFSGIRFTGYDPTYTGMTAYITVESFELRSLNCFCAGTMIATPEGERPVEDLLAGHRVLTADGREVPVTWLGVQDVNTRLMHPKRVNPVCIKARALGKGQPNRDLYLSMEHAVEIGGLLHNAGALVNGQTIFQVRQMPLEGFAYYHVDTGAHELLLANGLKAESYIDFADTLGFPNGDTRRECDAITEMSLPGVSAARQLPVSLRYS